MIVDCRLMIDGDAAKKRKSHKAPVVVIPAKLVLDSDRGAGISRGGITATY